MNLETLNSYVETLVIVAYGRAVDPGELTSGGTERVWCESEAKAIELFCMEFSNYIKANPGELLWAEKPHLLNQKLFTKTPGHFFAEVKLYCVAASFEIITAKQEEPENAAA